MITFFKMRKRNHWLMWAKRVGGAAALAGGALAVMRIMKHHKKNANDAMEYYQDEDIPVVTNT